MTEDQPLPGDPTRTEGEGETLDMPEGLGTFTSGQILGERYQILEMLGRGGMGEVWHAFDLKLRVEVALKALREDLFKSERRLELLRDEVRAAREVVSPNVCRIFDLIEIEGRELVSMEHVDGATLLGVLQERGPLELKEAQDIASQFLAGLEAIHKVGLVHRDIKPENIMLTRAGRVVVMDFGLAREETEGGGTVAGTPAYMSPEQAAGQILDARADVYSAGVVLAEMVSPEGIADLHSRQSVWEGVRSEPANVPDTPWAQVIEKAVARDRERRYNTAHTLVRALEDVTLRVEGADDLHPYPGLSSFTEENAEYFFGREAEVEQMWRKLEGPPRMLALVGPSGAGKSSFIGAGLLATTPTGWSTAVCTPGNAATTSLGRVMARVMAGDPETAEKMMDFQDPDVAVEVVERWKQQYDRALLVVDQFEELFTQNSVEEQNRFARLLHRIVLEADVFVVLSMRDDFLMRCRDEELFRPIFADMTALPTLAGDALRRALVQPATKCGYRFEDDDLVEEMLAEVEGERGALPLLAFAAARLWEKRDRETGLLTRQAYQDIGGVGGALARHAETTIDRIGTDRIAIVRELFRNLVTAEGTRAVREWNDLLSIFSDSQSESQPEEVLRQLIDARLLTSYEVQAEDEAPTRSVEIIHESLLANWPRLVRWQTQDQEGAQLRDELRQAAKAWDEHGRHDDRLWTGTAFREYALWRERYSGGLSELEEAFAAAMTSLATRRRRRRRIAVTAFCAALVVVASVVAALWQRSAREARRAEAAGLLSQAQAQLDTSPTAALAFATASLERADSSEARRLALTALWRGPTAFVVNDDRSWEIDFTPDGRWLVQAMDEAPYQLKVIGEDGRITPLDDVHDGWVAVEMDTTSDVFATLPWGNMEPWVLWSASEQRLLSLGRSGDPKNTRGFIRDLRRRRMLLVLEEDQGWFVDAYGFDGTVERLGALPIALRRAPQCSEAPGGTWTAYVADRGIQVIEFRDHTLSGPKPAPGIQGDFDDVECEPSGRFIATHSPDDVIRIWDLTESSPPLAIDGPENVSGMRFSTDATLLEVYRRDREANEMETWIWSLEDARAQLLRHINLGKGGASGGVALNPRELQLISIFNPDPKTRLWPLRAPADSEPVILQLNEVGDLRRLAVHPRGQWAAFSTTVGLSVWPIDRPYPIVIKRYGERMSSLAFDPEGRWLATSTIEATGTVRVWQLEGRALPEARTVHRARNHAYEVAPSPDGHHILLGTHLTGTQLLSLDGSPPRRLTAPADERFAGSTAFSPNGRFAAASTVAGGSSSRVRIWDLASNDDSKVFELGNLQTAGALLRFMGNDHLLISNMHGLRLWDRRSGSSDSLFDGPAQKFAVTADNSKVLFSSARDVRGTLWRLGEATTLEIDTGKMTPLKSHGDRVTAVAMDAEGTMAVTGDVDGVIRVGLISGEEPHLLLGEPGEIFDVAIDPRGRWIAASSNRELRLWPMPDLSKPPLHTLPREELIAKLKTLTNLRVVRDPESATGWKLTHDPFPGWETVPTW